MRLNWSLLSHKDDPQRRQSNRHKNIHLRNYSEKYYPATSLLGVQNKRS